ncbi:MAG TPA: hypothetical protein VE076_11140 [Nitrososphaeraceae archaeon]|nr:hypothetical protein [Nitrososphaeraceae archaeon]
MIPDNQISFSRSHREAYQYGFTLDLLVDMTSNDLAETLGIDKYVAKIIKDAAVKRIKK